MAALFIGCVDEAASPAHPLTFLIVSDALTNQQPHHRKFLSVKVGVICE
jgi:hypothetical protein